MKRIVFLALVLAACSASAQVTKCKLPNGTITYGDGPCPAGAMDSRVNTTANVVDGSDQRAAAARMRDERLRNDQPAPEPTIIGSSKRPGGPTDDQACRAAQRDLDMATSRVCTEVARGNHPGPSGSAVKAAERKVDAACGTNMAGARAEAIARNPPPPPPPPVPPVPEPPAAPRMITDCQGAACYDNKGDIYWRKGDTPYVVTPNGQTCRNVNGHLMCP